MYTCDSGHFSQLYRFAKFPAKPGDICVTLENTFNSSGNGQAYGRAVDTTDIRVQVPAGKFNSYVYRIFSYSKNSDVLSSVYAPGEYYCPGIGPIQFGYFNADGTHDRNAGADQTWQLVRAELK
jgi:hypothetical protein